MCVCVDIYNLLYGIFFTLRSSKKGYFFYYSCIWPVDSKSDVHFHQPPEPETLDYPENTQIFWIIGGFRYLLTKMDTGFRFCRSKKPWVIFHQSGKFPLSRNIRIDNSECHAITVTEKTLKTSKMKVLQKKKNEIQCSFGNCQALWCTEFLKKVIAYVAKVEHFKTFYTSSAPSALHFVPHCLQSALSRRPKLCFDPEQLIKSTLFAAGGNKTLELTSNWTAKVYFLLI